MKFNFSISEFCIVKEDTIPTHVADKILYHIGIIQPIRNIMQIPIHVSKHSGYRPHWYELQHNRSGKSEHCFFGMGAVDYTCDDIETLVDLLIQSKYIRVCYYPNHKFVHCDLKELSKKQFYICENGIDWIRK